MKKDIKKKWIKALRSGRYKQTMGMLEDSKGRNCCLGVLCRVMRLHKAKVAGKYDFFYKEDQSYIELPLALRVDLNIQSFEERDLIHMNDEGSTFTEIADWIEKNL